LKPSHFDHSGRNTPKAQRERITQEQLVLRDREVKFLLKRENVIAQLYHFNLQQFKQSTERGAGDAANRYFRRAQFLKERLISCDHR